jgi:hypothetical protein
MKQYYNKRDSGFMFVNWETFPLVWQFRNSDLFLDICKEKKKKEGRSKNLRTESITKYTLTTINTRWEAMQIVMATKLTRMTYKIAIQLHLVAEGCSIWSSRSRRLVRKLLDTPSYGRQNIILSSFICTRWTTGVLGFDSWRGLVIFLFTTASRTILGLFLWG